MTAWRIFRTLMWMLCAVYAIVIFPANSHAGTGPRADLDMALRALPCTSCHGPQGRATADGFFPRIAGKPSRYLFNQLRNFRDGRRHYAPMSDLLQVLDDTYLLAIASHFANLSLPYPPPQTAAASAATMRTGNDLVTNGDQSAQVPACVACHGEAMMGNGIDIPPLLGLPRDYLNAQFGAWRNGTRSAAAPDCMALTARRLTITQINALSVWLSSQVVPRAVSGETANQEATKRSDELPMRCATGK